MKHCILFRSDRTPEQEEEYDAAASFFPVYTHRTSIWDRVVIGRYSVLPNYAELQGDLRVNNAELVHTPSQHRWIADFEYYEDLKEFTPKTYKLDQFRYCESEGPFVVKGATNSRKWRWNEHMFAANRKEALSKALGLMDDSLIGCQDILIREYVPLVTHEIGINGLPFTEEWRLFYLYGQYVAHGFYWSTASEELVAKKNAEGIEPEGMNFADEVASRLSSKIFVAIDIAKTVDGRWILIELNDGQMSGLSEISPMTFYKGLSEAVKNR